MGAHDEQALACALAVVRKWDPHEIVILGDWLDGALFSRHPKRTFQEDTVHGFLAGEVGPVNEVIDEMQQQRGTKRARRVIYIEGNHEARIETFAVNLGGKLGGDMYKLLSPKRLIVERVDADGHSLGRRTNFTWVPYNADNEHARYVVVPETAECTPLVAVHGWSFAKNFAAANLALARSHSIVTGHTHRYQVAETRDTFTGKRIMSWSPGCLAKLAPPYMQGRPADWTHGMTALFVGKNGWTPYHLNVTNRGRVILPDGSEVTA